MKLRNVLIVCLLVGCSTNIETKTLELNHTDSLIAVSDSMMAKAECSSKVLDSVTTVTTEKVTGNIDKLTETITNYETQIKSAIKVKNIEKIIRDTVYIETKKSFWGKTKKSITTKSDSTFDQSETIDTTQQ